MKKLLVCENVIKSLGERNERRNVLNKVSFEMEEGEFLSVMGPSGSGKTTLLFTVSGMEQPDSGTVRFDGQNLAALKGNQLSDLRRTAMGFVFQQPTMLRSLSLLDNIILPAAGKFSGGTPGLADRARELMKLTGIADLEPRNINQVSGGQLQRAGICRALIANPRILFGDEPTGALNSKTSGEIMDIFTEVNRAGTSILLVTHDPGVAARSGRVLFMRDGNFVDELHLGTYSGGLSRRKDKIALKMQKTGI